MNSRQKSKEISSLLFTVTSTALHRDLYFFKFTQPLTGSTAQLLYTVKEKGGKPDIRKPFLIYDFATAPLGISLYMRKI